MQSKLAVVPRHVAIVMDGNGRWAKARLMPRLMGHHRGVETVRTVIRYCSQVGVEYLTLFAFSSENWQRPPDEVNGLMNLFMRALDREAEKLLKRNVRLCFIGERSAFAPELQTRIAAVEAQTAHCTGLCVIIAANYGGRWDVLQAAQRCAEQVASGQLNSTDLTEAHLQQTLATAAMPDPDLFIRTGGERRISNFLLWQLAYTELYFTDILWPEFDQASLEQAFADFAKRQRRFGMTSEQVQAQGQHHA